MRIGAVGDEATQKQCGGDTACEPARGGVIQIGDTGFDQRLVGRVEGHTPDGVGVGGGSGFQRGDEIGIVAEIGGQIGAHGDPCGTGQRRHRDNLIGLVLVRQCQRIGQHQPAFGVGIVDLDREALARGQDVLGAESIAGDRVFNRGDQHAQLQVHPRGHDHMRQTQHRRRATHILFHQTHRRAGFQVQPTGVKTHAFAHQRQLFPGFAPGQVDQPGRAVGGAADGMDQRQVLRQQIVARDDRDPRPVLICEFTCCGFQIGWAHIRGGRVDQVAGQHLPFGEGADVIGVDPSGRNKAGGHRRLRGIAVKPIGREQPPQSLHRELCRGQVGVQVIVALGQLCRGTCQMEAPPFAGAGRAVARQSHAQRAIFARQRQRLPQRAGKPLCRDPSACGIGLPVEPVRQGIGRNQIQRDRSGGGIGEESGHRAGPFVRDSRAQPRRILWRCKPVKGSHPACPRSRSATVRRCGSAA